MKNKKIIIALVTVLLLLCSFWLYTKNFKRDDYSITNYYLDTVNEVKLINARKKSAKDTLTTVDKIILDVHNKMNSHLANTEVSKINENAGIKPVKVSNETLAVIKEALLFSKKTKGTFDITIGPLTNLWNIGNENARLPSEKEIADRLPLINYNFIEVNDKDKTVFLKKKGAKIDLGGIAKGYCADRIHDYLKKKNIKDAIINLGGNVFVMGQTPEKKDFVVGIQNPSINKAPIGKVSLSNKSVVTSGIYERFFKKDGKIYHHMLNPKNGYPFENQLLSVTIISNKSIEGDALSTSVYGLGLEKGKKFIEGMKNIEAIFISKDHKVYITKGLKGNFVLEDPEYKLVD